MRHRRRIGGKDEGDEQEEEEEDEEVGIKSRHPHLRGGAINIRSLTGDLGKCRNNKRNTRRIPATPRN